MTNEDQDQLRLLKIFHYVVGGMCCLFGCFPMIHFFIGLWLTLSPPQRGGMPDANAAFLGPLFMILGGIFISIGWGMGLMLLAAGRNLSRRRRYQFCFVAACIGCLFTPFGTILGVFTILVLNRPAVKAAFDLPTIDPHDHFSAPPRFGDSL